MQFYLSDFHTDLLSSDLSVFETEKYLRDNAEVLACLAVFTRDGESPLPQLSKFLQLPKDIDCRIAFENLHFVVPETVDFLALFRPVYCSLTWNNENGLAGGCYSNGRLTRMGKEVCEALRLKNISVDTAHLNRESFFDLLEIDDLRIVNSHTAFSSAFSHPRNIDDEQIYEILARKGLVGLTLVSEFIDGSRECSTEAVLRQIDYFCTKFGSDSLCLGTDFFGTDNLPENIKNYEMCLNLVEKLLKIGYNGDTVRHILCDNLLEFIQNYGGIT